MVNCSTQFEACIQRSMHLFFLSHDRKFSYRGLRSSERLLVSKNCIICKVVELAAHIQVNVLPFPEKVSFSHDSWSMAEGTSASSQFAEE